MQRIAQIHVLPRHFIDSEQLTAVQELLDRAHECPRRQSLDHSRRADEVGIHTAGGFVALNMELFDAADVFAIDVVHFRTEQQLDVDVHHSSSSLPPPGMRSMMCFAIQISQSSAPVSRALTSTLMSLPTVITRDQGILTGSLRFGPHSLASLVARRPRAGCTRVQRVGPPIRI